MDAPPKSRALAALPAVEPLLQAAERAQASGDLEGALEAHKKALLLIPPDDRAARASALAGVGTIKRAQGRSLEAASYFEKALSASPGHRRSVDALIALATEAREWDRVVRYRRQLADAQTDDQDRLAELRHLADVLDAELHDRRAAALVLEEARALAPRSVPLLHALRGLYERTNQWAKAAASVAALADLEDDPQARAALHFARGDIALGRLRQEPEGLAAMEAALADHPAHERALAAVEAVRARRGDWAELAAIHEMLVAAHAKRGDADRAYASCMQLAALRRDKLRDGPGALEAYEGAKRVRAGEVEPRANLAELLAAKGDGDAAIAELEALSVLAPERVHTYERLFSLHYQAGRLDQAWLAAQSLDALGAASMDQEVLLDQFRPEGAVRPARALDDAAWRELLAAHDRGGGDDVVADVLRAIGPAAIAARIADLAARRRLPSPDPAQRQDPAGTISVVRVFAWASKVLDVPAPEVYVLDDVPGGLAIVPATAPQVAVGRDVLHGIPVQELAFLAARHLAYFRPEHRTLVFFPTLDDLLVLFLAAVSLAMPSAGPGGGAVAAMRAALERHVTAGARVGLGAAVARLDARGGTADLAAWVRGVEFTAGRAGLLLAGDLAVALGRVGAEARDVGGMTPEERRLDLLSFCASRRHAALRSRLQIGAGKGGSMPPPPGSVPPPRA